MDNSSAPVDSPRQQFILPHRWDRVLDELACKDADSGEGCAHLSRLQSFREHGVLERTHATVEGVH